LRRLAFALAGVALGLVAGELALRAFSPGIASDYFVWPPHLERVFRPSPGIMPGVEGPARFFVGSLGLRGDELGADDDLRVLAVGGSTTECLYLDQGEAWPQRLQVELARLQHRRPWVGNAGRSGLNARDHLVQLRHLLPQLPRMDVVVLLVGLNDMMLALAQDEAWDAGFLDREGAEAELLARAFDVRPLAEEHGLPFHRRTALWRLIERMRAELLPARTQDTAGERYRSWREHRASAARWRTELPGHVEAALDEYRQSLRSLIATCRERGAVPLLVTQPAMWRSDLPEHLDALLWMGGVGDYQSEPGHEYYTPAALARGMELYNRALLEVAGDEEVNAFDLAAAMPRDASAFYDDVHFNEAGARRVAELLARHMVESGLLARAAHR
jgi:lysophospholipase L1-like esterase